MPHQDRLLSLDVLRGVAVMGILLLNIVSFGMPEAAYLDPRAFGGWHGADLAVYLVNFVLFDGKMRGLFSFLFGASMLLVIERAKSGGRSPAAVHYARMIWLLLFGLAHLWLVWMGDILSHYALIGMGAFWLRRFSNIRLLVLAGMLIAWTTLWFSLMPVMVHMWASSGGGDAAEIARLTRAFTPTSADLQAELALYRSDYLTIIRVRFMQEAWSPLTLLLLFGPETLAYMLFGIVAYRTGMLTGAWPRARYVRWLLLCWGIAVPVYVAAALHLVHAQFGLFALLLSGLAVPVPFRPLMITGWICLILILARSQGILTNRIAATGRMAFTNYLMTSLICTTLFYGYGFGWYGHLSRGQLYPVVAVVCTLMLLWSKPWLDRFRFGPFEWLWRSLARGAVQPMRRDT